MTCRNTDTRLAFQEATTIKHKNERNTTSNQKEILLVRNKSRLKGECLLFALIQHTIKLHHTTLTHAARLQEEKKMHLRTSDLRTNYTREQQNLLPTWTEGYNELARASQEVIGGTPCETKTTTTSPPPYSMRKKNISWRIIILPPWELGWCFSKDTYTAKYLCVSLLTRGRPNLTNLTCFETGHPSSTLNTMIGAGYTETGRFAVTFPSVVALQYGTGNMSHRSCGGKRACCHRCLYAACPYSHA
jgi:hypothetical protein